MPADRAEAERRLRAWLRGDRAEWGRAEIAGVLGALDATRADVERLRARTHEIQEHEDQRRARMDAAQAAWRRRYDKARRWSETVDPHSPFSPFNDMSDAFKWGLIRLVDERREARAEVERQRAALRSCAAKRDEARAEVERLAQRLADAQPVDLTTARTVAGLRVAAECGYGYRLDKDGAKRLISVIDTARAEVERLSAQRRAGLALADELDREADNPRPDADYNEREQLWSAAGRIRAALEAATDAC